jgi:cysteine synthase A
MLRLSPKPGVEIHAKLEWQQFGGSVKARPAFNIIHDAIVSGALRGKRLLDASCGNTGIALAANCAAQGLKLVLTMPDSMSIERRNLLKALGAQLVLTPAAKGMSGAISKAQELQALTHDSVLLQQFENPSNPEIHRLTTALEILEDTDKQVDAFVAAVGTGGTITGTSQVLKEHIANIAIIAVEPTDSDILSGGTGGPHKIQGIGAGFIPGNLDLSLVDAVEKVSNEEAFAMAHRLMKEEGILAGISSGAAVVAAKRLAELPENQGKNIVVILASSAERYLSSPMFSDTFTEQDLA